MLSAPTAACHGLRGPRKHIGWHLASSAGRAPVLPEVAQGRGAGGPCTVRTTPQRELAGIADCCPLSAEMAEIPERWPHERRRARPRTAPGRPSLRAATYRVRSVRSATLPAPDPTGARRRLRHRVLWRTIAAAEALFSLSQGMLKRQTLPDIIASPARSPPSSPRCGALALPSTNTASTSDRRAAASIAWSMFPAARCPTIRPDRADAAAALDGADDRAPAHAPRRRALRVSAWRRCWRTRSRTRCRASAAPPSCCEPGVEGRGPCADPA